MELGLREGRVVLTDDDEVLLILTPDEAGAYKLAEYWGTHPRSLTLNRSLTNGHLHGLRDFNYDEWFKRGHERFKRVEAEMARELALDKAFSIRRMVEAVAPLRGLPTPARGVVVDTQLILAIIEAAEELAEMHRLERPEGT